MRLNGRETKRVKAMTQEVEKDKAKAKSLEEKTKLFYRASPRTQKKQYKTSKLTHKNKDTRRVV